MTGFAMPPLALSRRTFKASGLLTEPLSSYADDGSVADAETIVRQIDNEIAARRARLQLIRDRVEEIERQASRQAEDAAQRARDEVIASVGDEIATLKEQIGSIDAEIEELQAASDDWYEIVMQRRLAETAR